MINIIGIAITFFLVFILLGKKVKSWADIVLGTWLSFIGLHLFLFYLITTEKYVTYPFLLGLEIPIPLVHGPFLFLYTTTLTNQKNNKMIGLLHFIPFILALLSLLSFFKLQYQQKINIYRNEGKGYEILTLVIFVAEAISGIVYTLLSLLKLMRHKKNISQQFSFIEKINLRWLLYLILGSTIIWLLVIFSDDQYIFSAVVLYVIFLGHFGIKQVGIFTNISPEIENVKTTSIQIPKVDNKNSPDENGQNFPERIKYEKSKISEEEISSIHEKLSNLMLNEKCFKDPQLNLSILAQKLDVHPNTLSQVINSVEQKNFYDYINLQRIEEFKEIVTLPQNQKFTLLSLAFDCGFNSKTAFNRNFKKVTGISPTEFLKQANISLQ